MLVRRQAVKLFDYFIRHDMTIHKSQIALLSQTIAEGFCSKSLREVIGRYADASAGDRVESVQDVEAARETRVVVHRKPISNVLEKSGRAWRRVLAVAVHDEIEWFIYNDIMRWFVKDFEAVCGLLGFGDKLKRFLLQRVLGSIPVYIFYVAYIVAQEFGVNHSIF